MILIALIINCRQPKIFEPFNSIASKNIQDKVNQISFSINTKITNPIKLPASQNSDKVIGISGDGIIPYNLFKKGMFTSFHNSQLIFKFKYTFRVDGPFYFSSFADDYVDVSLWCFALTITYFGALALPIRAKKSDMTQHRKNTSKLRPHCEIEG